MGDRIWSIADPAELLAPLVVGSPTRRTDDPALNLLVLETRTLSAEAARMPDEPRAGDMKDWARLEARCRAMLREQSRHLELTTWLVEAWTRLYGLDGLANGLDLVTRLLEHHWDEMEPEIETPGGTEGRAALLEELDGCLPRVIGEVMISAVIPRFTLRRYCEGSLWPTPSPALGDDYRWVTGRELLDDPDRWRELAPDPSLPWHLERAAAQVEDALGALGDLHRVLTTRPELSDVRWSRTTPSTRWALERLQAGIREISSTLPTPQPVSALATDRGATPSREAPSPPLTREAAIQRLAEATVFVCREDPDSPACFLLERALRLSAVSRDRWLADLETMGGLRDDQANEPSA